MIDGSNEDMPEPTVGTPEGQASMAEIFESLEANPHNNSTQMQAFVTVTKGKD